MTRTKKLLAGLLLSGAGIPTHIPSNPVILNKVVLAYDPDLYGRIESEAEDSIAKIANHACASNDQGASERGVEIVVGGTGPFLPSRYASHTERLYNCIENQAVRVR